MRKAHWPGWLVAVLTIVLLPSAGGRSALGQAPPPSEYQIKAAFLLNFAQFIQLPAHTLPEGTPFTVGVLGDDPFKDLLEQTFRGATVQGHPLAIRRSNQTEDLKGCQMVFVSRSERDRLGQVLATLGDAPIVTVSEIDEFPVRGGVIGFYLEDNKIRFEINIAAAERKRLRISAELLRRARLTDDLARAD